MLDDQPKPRLGTLLEDVHQLWRDSLREALERRRAPLLGAGADLLAQLSTSGISQSLLAQRMGMTKQAVQQSLDQLERQGLVRRAPDPVDLRAKYVVLTEAGLHALEARRDAERELERSWTAVLGKKTSSRLKKALRRAGAGLAGRP